MLWVVSPLRVIVKLLGDWSMNRYSEKPSKNDVLVIGVRGAVGTGMFAADVGSYSACPLSIRISHKYPFVGAVPPDWLPMFVVPSANDPVSVVEAALTPFVQHLVVPEVLRQMVMWLQAPTGTLPTLKKMSPMYWRPNRTPALITPS